MTSSSLSLRFAETLIAAHAAAVEPAAIAAATGLLIDGLAVAALGSTQPGPRILASMALAHGGKPIASMFGHTARVAGPEAARVNGAAMHVLDYEPMWNPANHSLSTTLPAVLALAEMQAGESNAIDGRAMLAALVLGIEAQQRLRLASGQIEPAGLLFHPPGAVGAFGSAVACSMLLGLDAPALAQAIGIAASRAGGIQANVGSMTKALHCGQAAMAGLEAALMASRGFTADPDALGGPRGYGAAFYGAGFTGESLTRERSALYVLAPGPAFKFFPSQYGTHFVIAAALQARREWFNDALSPGKIEDIASVRIVMPDMPYIDRPAPATGLDGKFSVQYVAALALIDGGVTVASFNDRRRFSPDVERLLPRFVIEVDPSREGRFDHMAVDLVMTLADGRIVQTQCDGPPGIWGRPAAPARLTVKAIDCLSGILTPVEAVDFVAQARGFAQMDGAAALALLARLRVDGGSGSGSGATQACAGNRQ